MIIELLVYPSDTNKFSIGIAPAPWGSDIALSVLAILSWKISISSVYSHWALCRFNNRQSQHLESSTNLSWVSCCCCFLIHPKQKITH